MFAFALTSGDPRKLPSALIGRPVPATDFAALEGLVEDGRPVPGLHERRSRARQGDGRQLLGVLVHRMHRGAPSAQGPRQPHRRRDLRRELQGSDGRRTALSRPLRQSLCRRRRGHRPQRHRVGRLRHARDVRHRRHGQDRLQARRRDIGRERREVAHPRHRESRAPDRSEAAEPANLKAERTRLASD